MIFKDILEPLIVPSFPEVFKKQRLDAENTSEILVDEKFPESSATDSVSKFLSCFDYGALVF